LGVLCCQKGDEGVSRRSLTFLRLTLQKVDFDVVKSTFFYHFYRTGCVSYFESSKSTFKRLTMML